MANAIGRSSIAPIGAFGMAVQTSKHYFIASEVIISNSSTLGAIEELED